MASCQTCKTIRLVGSVGVGINCGMDGSASAKATPSLRQVYTGGESLSHHHAKKCLSRLPNLGIYNVYGPTEAGVTCRG